MENQLLEMLMKEDEITWQTIIQNLVKSEEMDPWDIDVAKLANSYLETLRKLEQMNFAISGKVILAAALLLKMKSNKLVEEDLIRFESLINPPEESYEPEFNDINLEEIEENQVVVIPKIPQPRRRKVSVEDLVTALQQALEVNKRRVIRQLDEINAPKVEIPGKKIDITKVIRELYTKITSYFRTNEHLTFTQLVKSDRKEDKIATFVPLLHLDTQRRILLNQEEHFGEISITLPKRSYYQSSFEENQALHNN